MAKNWENIFDRITENNSNKSDKRVAMKKNYFTC